MPLGTTGQEGGWARRRERLRLIIFEADTPAGKVYDVALILTILFSVTVVMLDSVAGVRAVHGPLLYGIEWGFTLLFTCDYLLRIACVARPVTYTLSFFGIVDLLGILPTYLSLFIPGSHYLAVIRFLRVLRAFRVLKLSAYQGESRRLMRALKASHRRVTVFLFFVLTLVVVLGALMYVVEGRAHGFTSIPRSIYWAVVTLTTVGYGDISPQTPLGQTLAAVIMILGYSIIVIPTGLVSAAFVDESARSVSQMRCSACDREGHDADAACCKFCGAPLR